MEEQSPAAKAQSWTDFSTRVAMLIAAMSVISTIVGWRASLAGIDSADLDRQLVQERMLVEATRLQKEEKIDRDQSLFARYQEHILAEHLLKQDAEDAYRANRPDLGAALDMRAQGELALARSMIPYFRVHDPELTETPGRVEYDAKTQRESMLITNSVLRTVHPEQTERRIEAMHRRTWSLYAVAALFVASVFLLTLAEFGPSPAKMLFYRAGVVAFCGGFAGWGLVEGLIR